MQQLVCGGIFHWAILITPVLSRADALTSFNTVSAPRLEFLGSYVTSMHKAAYAYARTLCRSATCRVSIVSCMQMVRG